MHFLHTKRTR